MRPSSRLVIALALASRAALGAPVNDVCSQATEVPEQFRWLRAYSPYHHVVDGTAYPAVLLATAESDSRVDPLHARKMAARLQRATSSGRPVLLRLEAKAGHGAGKPLAKVLDELTDTWTFIFHEVGLA